jgi:hypothetical protein
MADEQQPKPASLGQRLESARRRGAEELRRKGGIPDQAQGVFKRWARSVWQVRGGGFYALGFIVTFAYLEVIELLFDDIPALVSMRDPFGGDLIDFVINFFIDTLMNMVSAFVWPVHVLTWQEPWGVLLLIAGFVLFPILLKKPLEHWLFDGTPPSKKPDSTSN